MCNKGDHNSFSDLFLVFLRTFDYLNLKLRIFSEHTASFKTGVLNIQDLGNFELAPISILPEPFERKKNSMRGCAKPKTKLCRLEVKKAWVKVFRINPEFRILRLTFHRKSASKC